MPLIANILDGVGTKKVFTKLDLCWGCNNVRINKGNKWEAVFTIHIGSYEPTVMYFRLTNLLATFQCQEANSESELSQLLFISIRQRELVKSSYWIWSIYLYRFYLVCALVSHTTM